MAKLVGFIFFMLLIILALAADDPPVRLEQTIYSVLAYNGRDFSPTFGREQSETIYLFADSRSVVSLKKVFVYYWPLSEDWRTDVSELNITFAGTLEIRDRKGSMHSVDQVIYTYFNVRGKYENNWHVLTGDDAEREIAKYQGMVADYMTAADEFRAANREFEMLFDTIAAAITELKSQGKDYSGLAGKLRELKRPVEPETPTYYSSPPTKLERGFIINLKPGEYDLLFRNLDGTIMEGSEKRLITFSPSNTGGIGYSIIPGDKWTRPVESQTPSSVIYVNGNTDLFLNPYYQNKVNDLHYNKMVKNDASGNPSVFNWIRVQQVPDARIEINGADGAIQILGEMPFMVEQTETATLGYRIVDFDPEGAHKGYKPSIIAIHVPLDAGSKAVKIRLVDDAGEIAPGSGRQIRIIHSGRSQSPLIACPVLPVVAMAVVLLRRRKSIKRLQEKSTLTPG